MDTKLKNQPRVGGIILMAILGFVLGQVVASLLDALFVSSAHFPGGLSALAKASEPPWWSNVAGLAGLWLGFGVAIYLAHHRGGLEPLAHAWRPRRYDAGFLIVGVGLQLL